MTGPVYLDNITNVVALSLVAILLMKKYIIFGHGYKNNKFMYIAQMDSPVQKE